MLIALWQDTIKAWVFSSGVELATPPQLREDEGLHKLSSLLRVQKEMVKEKWMRSI
jgi:hypothetical protein